jgi:hypothetical protein
MRNLHFNPKESIMTPTTLSTVRQHIINSEKRREWPYLDIKGNVTIGTGFKIDSEDAFAMLPLEHHAFNLRHTRHA